MFMAVLSRSGPVRSKVLLTAFAWFVRLFSAGSERVRGQSSSSWSQSSRVRRERI